MPPFKSSNNGAKIDTQCSFYRGRLQSRTYMCTFSTPFSRVIPEKNAPYNKADLHGYHIHIHVPQWCSCAPVNIHCSWKGDNPDTPRDKFTCSYRSGAGVRCTCGSPRLAHVHQTPAGLSQHQFTTSVPLHTHFPTYEAARASNQKIYFRRQCKPTKPITFYFTDAQYMYIAINSLQTT